MRIAMIGQKIIPSRSGGIEVHVLELAKRMVAEGHEVDVICRRSHCEAKTCKKNHTKAHCQYNNIDVLCVDNIKTKSLDAISYSFFATLKVLFKKYDVIHYHALGPSTMAFLPRLFGKKVVCTVHGLDWQRDKWGGFATKYLKFGEYATAKFANKTITVGKKLVSHYKEKYNKVINYIPNGIDKPDKVANEIIKKKYGLETDDYFLFLARLVPEKNCHQLIEAYKNSNLSKKLVIAGGSSHSNEYEAKLHRQAEGHENIIFTGFITGRILEELYSNAYTYVLPSSIEGLPISLLEALSYGNCCLVSDIEENLAVVRHNGDKYGHTFEVDSIESLTSTMEFLEKNESLVNDYKAKASDYVTEHFDWDVVVSDTLKVYKEAIAG